MFPLLPALVFLPGCTGNCTGAGCGADFSAGLLSVVRMSPARTTGTRSSTSTYSTVEGTLALGVDWDFVLAPGRLVVGSPVENAVRSFPLERGARTVDDADGLVQLDDTSSDFGRAVARVPDLDGDGIAELAVGAPAARRSNLTRRDGAVHLLTGVGDGAASLVRAEDATLAVVYGADEGGSFGRSIAVCPDLDGDGLAELLVAAPLDNLTWSGAAVDLAGSVTLLRSRDLAGAGTAAVATALGRTLVGTTTGGRAGTSLDCAHDLNGDGTADLVVGEPFGDGPLALGGEAEDADTGLAVREASGRVYLVDGATAGGEDAFGSRSLPEAAFAILEGPFTEGWMGWSVSTGDLDGDGQAEVVVGAPGVGEAAGAVWVWTGSQLRAGALAFPRFRWSGLEPSDGLGRALALADVDGDGLADLLAGAPGRAPAGEDSFDAGALYLRLGAGDFTGWLAEDSVASADAVWAEATPYLRTGSVIRTGDIDGDGDADFGLLNRIEP